MNFLVSELQRPWGLSWGLKMSQNALAVGEDAIAANTGTLFDTDRAVLQCGLTVPQELYLIGGDYRCNNNYWRTTVMEILHLPSNSMRTLPLAPSANRRNAAGAVLSRNIYICGGILGSSDWEDSCLCYNVDTETLVPVCLAAGQR